MGRSWADHGQTMGDRFMQKNPENFSFFRYRFFAEKLWKFAIFPLGVNKAFSYFCRPRTCFLGEKRLYFGSNINFTPRNRLFSQQWLILHVETGMFCKDLLDSARSVVFGRTTMTSQLKRWRIRYLGQWRVRRRKAARVTRQCDARPSWAAASFIRVCSRTISRNWRRRGTPRCCSIHGLITCAMSTMQKWWIRSVPCWTNPRTTP